LTVVVALAIGRGIDRGRLAGALARAEEARLYAVRANKAILEFLEKQGYHADGFPVEVYREEAEQPGKSD
jgi:hypothetical protein